jgi:hypothetical protein
VAHPTRGCSASERRRWSGNPRPSLSWWRSCDRDQERLSKAVVAGPPSPLVGSGHCSDHPGFAGALLPCDPAGPSPDAALTPPSSSRLVYQAWANRQRCPRVVRRSLWAGTTFRMLSPELDVVIIPRPLVEHLTELLSYADYMGTVQLGPPRLPGLPALGPLIDGGSVQQHSDEPHERACLRPTLSLAENLIYGSCPGRQLRPRPPALHDRRRDGGIDQPTR